MWMFEQIVALKAPDLPNVGKSVLVGDAVRRLSPAGHVHGELVVEYRLTLAARPQRHRHHRHARDTRWHTHFQEFLQNRRFLRRTLIPFTLRYLIHSKSAAPFFHLKNSTRKEWQLLDTKTTLLFVLINILNSCRT